MTRKNLARVEWIGSGRMDWFGQNGLARAEWIGSGIMDWFGQNGATSHLGLLERDWWFGGTRNPTAWALQGFGLFGVMPCKRSFVECLGMPGNNVLCSTQDVHPSQLRPQMVSHPTWIACRGTTICSHCIKRRELRISSGESFLIVSSRESSRLIVSSGDAVDRRIKRRELFSSN